MAFGKTGSKLVAVVVSLFAGQMLIVGCNAALGIEPAELEDPSASGSKLQCNTWRTPSPDCATCDETCANRTCDVAGCLMDDNCRFALFNFDKCVGSACVDAQGECGDCISGNAKAKALAACLKSCGPGCALSGAASLCQGYCACMHQQCSENEPNAQAPQGCFQACMGGLPAGIRLPLNDPDVSAMWVHAPSAAQIGCLWYHCEAANPNFNDHFHCDHAIGLHGMCNDPPKEDPHSAICQFPKRYGTAPCNGDAECCSGNCTDMGVCTSPGTQ